MDPVLVDALDAASLTRAVAAARPDIVVHQLTDLRGRDYDANNRLRIDGTRNLVAAAKAVGVEAMVAQSIAWIYAAGERPAVETDPLDLDVPPIEGVLGLEQAVAELPRGVVLRYGVLYGPGTWYAADGEMAAEAREGRLHTTPSWTSFLHVDDAAAAALAALDWPAGAVNIVDDEPATALDWLPAYCDAIGAPPPQADGHDAGSGRPISNTLARQRGWSARHSSWRTGFAAA